MARAGQRDDVAQIMRSAECLADDPYRPRSGADILRLEAVDRGLYRLRVGKYRVLYCVDKKGKVVNVTTVLLRKKAYR